MFTCPKCGKEMHSVCGNKNCKCYTWIPEGELPMVDKWLIFGRFIIPQKTGSFIWRWMWRLNIGKWLQTLTYNIYSHKKPFRMMPTWVWRLPYYLGITPDKFMFELELCPYCGFAESYSYWESRSIDQYLESEGVSSFSELDKKQRKDKEDETNC